MKLKRNCIFFNAKVNEIGGTPDWEHTLGQSSPLFLLKENGCSQIINGLVYNIKDPNNFSYGNGGNNYDVEIVSVFENVNIVIYDSELKTTSQHSIEKPFIIILVKQNSGVHINRRLLKFSNGFTYNNINNTDFYDSINEIIINPWFAYKLEYDNEHTGALTLTIIKAPILHPIKENQDIRYIDKDTRKNIWENLINEYSEKFEQEIKDKLVINKSQLDKTIQKIFYGPPGTGKSHIADLETNNFNVEKVTFHPDYDYNSFVGGYKPTMIGEGNDSKIAYKFVPQIFTKIYIKAWRNFASSDETLPFYLQIEEINRGNCAEIFGDLFQLLDRNIDGSSKYKVSAEEELKKYLESEKGLGDANHEGIRNGYLRLPSNLKIIATMNTSDQSLFPMDSAFKRRWDWVYVPINYNCKKSNFIIKLENGKEFKWLEFLKKVNKEIFEIDKNQDKQIGNWFINAELTDNVISESTFVNKVIFYLWNDVFKDEEKTIFRLNETENITYTSFFEKEISANLLSDILEKRLDLIDINEEKDNPTE